MVLDKLISIGQFGRQSAGGRGPSVTVSVLLPVDVLAELDELCEEFNCPRSAAMRELITEGVKRLEGEWLQAQKNGAAELKNAPVASTLANAVGAKKARRAK